LILIGRVPRFRGSSFPVRSWLLVTAFLAFLALALLVFDRAKTENRVHGCPPSLTGVAQPYLREQVTFVRWVRALESANLPEKLASAML
jgi:hypothetical protein